MALIEYDIQYGNGKPRVTRKVVQVDKGDRILFKPSDANIAIRYKEQSPFRGSEGPQADAVFVVGEDPGPFEVTVASYGPPRKFECGEMEVGKGTGAGETSSSAYVSGSEAGKPQRHFTVWEGVGNDTP